jgi:adenylate cyclase
MFTDMVGYTALGQRDEPLSLALVDEQRKLLRPIFNRHSGKEIKTIGDGFLVEFSNALDAVRCAYDVQRASREFNISRPSDQRFGLRIGLHLGDVIESQGDISGDAVNVASRIQPLAEDGGVCITRQVYDQVQNKFELPLRSMGSKSLKNVNSPIEVYRMSMPWQDEQPSETKALDSKRVAVLPFANMSPDPNDSYFADGITEEIISTLSGVSGLSVISRTSVMGYKGSTKKVKEIGTELEAGSILEGSFRKSGNKVRVTTQLIAVNSDKHVWTQSYDRSMDDVFAVQSDIARQVSDALRVKILAPEMNRIERKPTESSKAYSLYLRGRYHWNRRGLEDLKKARQYFRQAIDEDPGFALGYVGLADSCEILAFNWLDEVEANHKTAELMISKALEIDPDLAEAHTTKGLVLTHDLNVKESELEFKTAIELKPNYATGHQWYSLLLVSRLEWAEALKQIEKAVELDPFSQIINLNHASYYSNKREYEKSVELYKKAIELDPSYATVHLELAGVYLNLNMLDEAKKEADTALDLLQGKYPNAVKLVEVMTAYAEKDTAKVRSMMPFLEEHVGEPLSSSAMDVGGFYMFLGDIVKGFEWLEKSYLKKEPNLLSIATDILFDGVRDDPRYLSLIKRLGLDLSNYSS